MIVPIATRPQYRAHLDPILRRLDHDTAGDVALVASFGDLLKARRRGFRRFILAQHGAGQSYSNTNPSYPGGSDNGDVGLFLVPNEHAAGRWRAAYPHAAVEVVGCPRLDDLPARQPGPPTVAVSFHWDGKSPPELRSALPWYRNAVVELASAFTVIGHGHPGSQNLPRFFARRRIEFVPDFDEVCRRADVYVCDNSSTLFEFASTGRNVVVLNAPVYRPEAKHGLRFWEAAGVGVNVWDPETLSGAVERALTTDMTDEREAALDIVYAYRHGAAQRAADAITGWAGARVAA